MLFFVKRSALKGGALVKSFVKDVVGCYLK